MSDERLRELLRRWRESGAPEDEAAYLAELTRQGRRPTCQRCGQEYSPTANAGVESGPVRLPSGEEQSTFVGGLNLTYVPFGEEAFKEVVDAYLGPGCRFHPEPFALHPTWPDGDDWYYDCCWSFREDLPGCQVAPHVLAPPP